MGDTEKSARTENLLLMQLRYRVAYSLPLPLISVRSDGCSTVEDRVNEKEGLFVEPMWYSEMTPSSFAVPHFR